MCKARSTRETGEMIRRTVKESTFTQTVLNMMVIGWATCKTERAMRSGLTARTSLGRTEMGRRTALENTHGPMELYTRENGKITRFPATDSMPGLMAESTSAIGRLTLWTSLESIPGLTEGCTKVSTKKIRSTASASTLGQIRNAMQAGGAKGNSTALASSSLPKKARKDLESGRTAARSSGFRQRRSTR